MRHRSPVAGVLVVSIVLAGAAYGVALGAGAPQQPPPAAPAGASAEQPEEKLSFWQRLRPRRHHSVAASDSAGEPSTGQEAQAAEQALAAVVPHQLVRIQARLRQSPIAADPVGRRYLDIVDRGGATAAQLNDFAILLSRRGYFQDAREYQRFALRLDDTHPSLWINLGTLNRALGDPSAAASAYRRALALDPNNAFAHYDLGTVLDVQGDYDGAVQQYRIALTLDPKMGDPKFNPQVVNNDRMLVVNLLNYGSQAGSMGLPFLPMGSPPQAQRAAAPAKATVVPPAAPPAVAPAPVAPKPQASPPPKKPATDQAGATKKP
jgi:tetratricopeptide (TPR) repeat protein